MIFRCEIPGRVYVKKNTRRQFGKFGGYYSPQFTAWERWAGACMKQAMQSFALPISDPINAAFVFEFKDRRAEPDLSNLIEGPQDLLQKMGVIVNDKQIVALDGSRKLFTGRDHLTIIISKI